MTAEAKRRSVGSPSKVGIEFALERRKDLQLVEMDCNVNIFNTTKPNAQIVPSMNFVMFYCCVF